MLEHIVESCHYLLQNYPNASNLKNYLDDRLSQQSQILFQFGFVPPVNDLQVLFDLVGEEILIKENFVYYRYVEDSLFPRNYKLGYFDYHPLVMPFRDPYGTIMGLVGRTLFSDMEMKDKKISKYKNTKNLKKGNLLFGLFENKQAIINQNSVFVVEGQFDAIKSMEIGLKNIIAIGNNNMTAYQFSIISRYTNNIFLLLDNDEAGEKGRKHTIEKYGHLANIRNFYIPDTYKDIDEYISKEKIDCHTNLSFLIKD